MKRIFIYPILIIAVLTSCIERKMTLAERLQTLPASKIESVSGDSLFSEIYELMIIQPVDHKNPDGPSFSQQVFLSYVGPDKPVVVITEGYGGRNYKSELADLLQCNQIIIEHRYFDDSRPDSIDWQYLTSWQAATDQHAIIELFKPVFHGKWITTGISKGGQTVMYHSYYYPNDVDVRVPYVGPLAFDTEDERIYSFLDNVGTPECREQVRKFQEMVLIKRDVYFPMMMELAAKQGWTFERVGGPEVAYEMSALEYDFAYWQWGNTPCDEIPLNGTDEEVFRHFSRIGDFSYFSDQGLPGMEPFFYQAMTELGYYGYRFDNFKDMLLYAKDNGSPEFAFAAPRVALPPFDKELNLKVKDYIESKADNFIFIYGEQDTWSAAAVSLSGRTNSVMIVKKGGDHRTRIRNLDAADRKVVMDKLSEWLELEVH